MSFRGGHYAVYRGPRRFWSGGVWRTLVGLSALGVVYYGTTSYYPYGYVAAARPYCGGTDEDGCTLTWRDVPTEDGGALAQCVQYCPQGVVPRPVAMVGPAPQPPAPTGNEDGCEVKGFSEPNLQGESFVTGDSYPTMDGWKEQWRRSRRSPAPGTSSPTTIMAARLSGLRPVNTVRSARTGPTKSVRSCA